MTKYIFNKNYETQVRASVVGGTGTGTRQIKIAKDTIVDGEEASKGLTSIKYESTDLNVDSSYLDIYSAPRSISNTVKEVIADKEKKAVKKTTETIFTFKNIALISLVLGAALGVLRYKKII